MDYSKERLVRYHFQLATCDGQPFMMHTVWVPEAMESEIGWAELFQGPPPSLNNPQSISVMLNPSHPYSPRLLITRS